MNDTDIRMQLKDVPSAESLEESWSMMRHAASLDDPELLNDMIEHHISLCESAECAIDTRRRVRKILSAEKVGV